MAFIWEAMPANSPFARGLTKSPLILVCLDFNLPTCALLKEHKIKRAIKGRHVFILVIGKSYLSDPKDCAIVAKNKS